ncbi:hypothetical protein [Pseudomonas sp. NFX98]|uniref:hypothetical protein n=1 Tax=Pseudomonas sp. NFX98 TaxID=3399122 RepID=UPI0039FD8EE3
MSKLVGIAAILLGSSNIAQAAIVQAPEQYQVTASNFTDTPSTKNPFSTKFEETKSGPLISTLKDYSPNDKGQKKLNATCN